MNDSHRCFLLVVLYIDGLQAFPDAPRSAFSLYSGAIDSATLPDQCPSLTSFTFDPASTPESEYPVKVALGFTSPEAKAAVYSDMARRMAGEQVLCEVPTSSPSAVPSKAPSADAPTSNAFSLHWNHAYVTMALSVFLSLVLA